MRLKHQRHHGLVRSLAPTATAAMLTMTAVLVWGAGVSFAKVENAGVTTYSDSLENLCFGSIYFNNCEWSRVTGAKNLALGVEALNPNTTGSENVASGNQALRASSGSDNVALGFRAGANLSTGSNNVDISNAGVESSEEGTTRIGTEGAQTRAFVAGVYPTAVSGCPVQVTESGQLGCNAGAAAASGAIATFVSRTGVASGDCLNSTEFAGPGHAACPGPTTGYSTGARLDGPMPANGATVSSLYADTSATVAASDTVLVSVIDNTTGATLLSCTVNSTTASHCENASAGAGAAAGDNLEVKVTAAGASGNNKAWRVRFRF